MVNEFGLSLYDLCVKLYVCMYYNVFWLKLLYVFSFVGIGIWWVFDMRFFYLCNFYLFIYDIVWKFWKVKMFLYVLENIWKKKKCWLWV